MNRRKNTRSVFGSPVMQDDDVLKVNPSDELDRKKQSTRVGELNGITVFDYC